MKFNKNIINYTPYSKLFHILGNCLEHFNWELLKDTITSVSKYMEKNKNKPTQPLLTLNVSKSQYTYLTINASIHCSI